MTLHALTAAAQSQPALPKDYAALLATPEANKYVLGELAVTAKEDRLKGFEYLKAVLLDAEPWSVDVRLVI